MMSMPLIFGGVVLMWFSGVLADEEGFWLSDTVEFNSDSYAIVMTPDDMDVDDGAFWWLGRIATLKIEGVSDNSSEQIFIGIAEASYVEEYLAGVAYDEIVEFDTDQDEIAFEKHGGVSEPLPPVSGQFWEVAAHGDETQTVIWESEVRDYSLVIMNAGGSAGIDASMSFGVKVPVVGKLGAGLLIAGVVILLVGGVMLFFALRSPGSPDGIRPTMTIVDE